jgi:hypothetical protein
VDGTADGTARAPRRPPAVQLGLLWGAAAAAAAAPLLAAPGLLARAAAVLPPCPAKALAGIPCPACGSGRALQALSQLDPAAAFALNPLFSVAAAAFLAGGLVALALALSGRGVAVPRTLPVAARAAIVLAVAANWAWLLLDGR